VTSSFHQCLRILLRLSFQDCSPDSSVSDPAVDRNFGLNLDPTNRPQPQPPAAVPKEPGVCRQEHIWLPMRIPRSTARPCLRIMQSVVHSDNTCRGIPLLCWVLFWTVSSRTRCIVPRGESRINSPDPSRCSKTIPSGHWTRTPEPEPCRWVRCVVEHSRC